MRESVIVASAFSMYTNRYSNIYVTSPSPENLKTLFEFVFKGFDALEYQVCACVVCCNVY